MQARKLTMVALCALLAACGSRGSGNSAGKAFDDSFDQSFQAKFVGSCVSSAANSGVARELAGKLCTCASDKVKQRFSIAQKMHLTKDQLRPILVECKASVPA